MTPSTSASSRLTAWLVAAAIALLCGAVLVRAVYERFDPVRFKIVRSPLVSQDGEASIVLPETPLVTPLQGQTHIVLIARVRNTGTTPAAITVRVNGSAIDTLKIAPGEKPRVDLVLPPAVSALIGPGASVGLRGQDSAWTLESLELANVHGSSTAILRFFIAPAGFEGYDAPPLWLAAIVMLAIAWLVRVGRRAPIPARWPVRTHRVVTIVILVFLTATLAAPLVSSFKILLAPESFALCVLCLTARGVWHAILRARAAVPTRFGWRPAVFDAVLVALVIAGFYTTAMFALREPFAGDYSALVRIGRKFADRNPFLQQRPDLRSSLLIHEGAGYDAEFAYFMAFDPFLNAFKDNPIRYRDVVDAPPYRFGRIGFTLLTKVFSGDRPERYPVTMVWLVIAGHFVGALCLAGIFIHYGRAAAWALLYVLVPGFLQSLHVTLPESIAGGLLLAGYLCWLRSRMASAAVLFAVALLVRETGAILVISLVLWELAVRKRPRVAATLAAAVVVLAGWRAYVCWRLFADWKWQGLFFDPENMGVPFKGFADLWTMIARGVYAPDIPHIATSGVWYPIVLTAALALAIVLLRLPRKSPPPGALAGALVVYGLVSVSLNYTSIWSHVGNAERGTYELLLFLIVAFASFGPAASRTSPRLRLAFTGFFGALAVYLITAAVDAHIARQVLMLPSW